MRRRDASARQKICDVKNFQKIEHLKKKFDDIKIDILLEQNQKNYIIELIKNKKLSFIFLYNLFQTKLTKFRRYIENILIKK